MPVSLPNKRHLSAPHQCLWNVFSGYISKAKGFVTLKLVEPKKGKGGVLFSSPATQMVEKVSSTTLHLPPWPLFDISPWWLLHMTWHNPREGQSAQNMAQLCTSWGICRRKINVTLCAVLVLQPACTSSAPASSSNLVSSMISPAHVLWTQFALWTKAQKVGKLYE